MAEVRVSGIDKSPFKLKTQTGSSLVASGLCVCSLRHQILIRDNSKMLSTNLISVLTKFFKTLNFLVKSGSFVVASSFQDIQT